MLIRILRFLLGQHEAPQDGVFYEDGVKYIRKNGEVGVCDSTGRPIHWSDEIVY